MPEAARRTASRRSLPEGVPINTVTQFQRRRSVRTLAAALGLSLLVSACGGSDEPTDSGDAGGSGSESLGPVTLSYAASSPIATIVASQERETWSEHGLDVTVEAVSDVGVATGLVISGDAELGHSAPTTAIQAISKGVPITIIAGMAFGTGDNQAGFLAAPASTGIETLGDLRGKRVAVTGLGTSYDFYLRARFADEGMTVGEDVQLVPVPYPQMRGALAAGEVDAALLLAIDYAKLSAEQDVNVIATTAELAGASIEYTSVIVARTDWLEENPDAATAFLAGLLEGETWMEEDISTNDGAGVKELLQPVLKYDEQTWETYFQYRLSDIGRESELVNPLSMPRDFIEPVIEALSESGALEGQKDLSYEDVVDLQYLEAAYEQLDKEFSEDVKYS